MSCSIHGGTNLSRFPGFPVDFSWSGTACYLYYLPRRVENPGPGGVQIGCKILKGLGFKILYVGVTGMRRAMLLGGLAGAVLPIGHG